MYTGSNPVTTTQTHSLEREEGSPVVGVPAVRMTCSLARVHATAGEHLTGVRATRYRRTGYRLPATGYRLPATGYR